MKFTKPAWVVHNDSASKDQSKPLSIFSCHVHPDGSRIATGGLDAKVRIWSTKPILNSASELSGRPPKSLCTLTMHTGPVLTVRWAHSGRWLASGSDDAIIMIWDLDPTARGKVWGSDEVNVEGWKPLKRLPGHESDVTDLAWSPGDRYLASVGLDSQVIIWCGFTLERLRRLDKHQGFVKGVCWDPVGEFLATQSDDRSVKVWRTTDWELEAEIKKPFEDSPGTFFRRLSWSPDGAHITASNATNNKGYVFIAAVIARNTWTSEISLVGHENTVEVAAYNPHIFLRDVTNPVVASNICSVVALGADDRSVSVWQTKSARPLIVAKDVFERQIMDLSWSSDGLTLYAVSSDGTMAVFNFSTSELEGIAPLAAQEQYLTKFGFTPPPLPTGFSHTHPSATDSRMTPPPSPGRGSLALSAHAHEGGFGLTNGSGEVVNKLVAKRNNKKRVQLSNFGGSVPSASVPSAANYPSTSSSVQASKSNGRSFHEIAGIIPSRTTAPLPITESVSSSSSAFGRPSMMEDIGMGYPFPDDADMSTEVAISSLDAHGKGKRKSNGMDFSADDRPSKARTLGGDRVREAVPVRELAVPSKLASSLASVGAGWSGGLSLAGRIPWPSLVTYLKVSAEGSEDTFEGRNSEDGSPSEVVYLSGKQTQWLDYMPSPVVALTATNTFCAAGLQDGSIYVYSLTGRKMMPAMSLGDSCSQISGAKNALLVLTVTGQLYAWNVKQQKALFPPTSIHPILGSTPNISVSSATIRANGTPIIKLTSNVVYSYDASLCSWTKLTDGWYAEGSDAWQGRQRANTQIANRGIVSTLESYVTEVGPPVDSEKERPAWWSTALTLGHLETRLHAAKTLDSPQEYKYALVLYAKKVADEGFRAKAEELVKELFGPTYWRPGRDDVWSPTVVGFSKRDLLRDVLNIFARSKTLTKLALDWQDTLKRATTDDY
ncbi:WD40 repeat-like protein [Irpex rosettiformis]|uniref:WD40 repeat-like protein n=1 Tax=Irpex rosettiformis TaxID=378272 RepID=A0ACB8TRR2_9APHY|nr:WD40 repeat-like protein [Irpex rosettiformis]